MNPEFHATATSPVIDVISNMRSTYSHNVTFKTHNRPAQFENMREGLEGFIRGYYKDKNIVFDKCRAWANNLPLIDKIFGHKETRVIWTYRDPVEIISSIEKHHQKTLILENSDEAGGVDFSTLGARVDAFINDNGIVARPVWLLSDAHDMGYADRILLVSYWDLTNNTQATLDKIHDFIGEERYQYDKEDFRDLKQTTDEFDGLYNYKFPHTIKEGEVKYVKHDVKLPQHIIEKINSRFLWVNELMGKR